MRAPYRFLALAAAALLGSAISRATPVTLLVDPIYVSTVDFDRTVDGGTTWLPENPGQFHIITQAGAPTFVPLDFYTFCIEPLDFVDPGSIYTFEVEPLEMGADNIGGMGPTRAAFLEELLFAYYPDFSVALDPVTAAALQASIWEIVREDSGSFSLTAGSVQYANWSNTTAEALAASMLASLTGSGPRLTNVVALTLDTGQDLMVQVTPEPSTLLLAGPALLFLIFRRKR